MENNSNFNSITLTNFIPEAGFSVSTWDTCKMEPTDDEFLLLTDAFAQIVQYWKLREECKPHDITFRYTYNFEYCSDHWKEIGPLFIDEKRARWHLSLEELAEMLFCLHHSRGIFKTKFYDPFFLCLIVKTKIPDHEMRATLWLLELYDLVAAYFKHPAEHWDELVKAQYEAEVVIEDIPF